MSFSGRLSSADLQNLAFPRRELLQKFVAIASLLLLPRTQPQPTSVEPQTQPQLKPVEPQPQPSAPKSYPLPEFAIGDSVAQDWEGEFGEKEVEYGEILGLRWSLKAYSCYPANTWLYYINWTHSTCDPDERYPCFDGEPTVASELRLIKES